MIAADVKTVRELDRLTLRAGVPGLTLMERAGDGVVEAALRMLRGKEKGRVLVVCGKGSNGGDGLDAARKLAAAGTEVAGLLLFSEKEFRGDALACLQKAREASVRLIDGRTETRWPDFSGFDLVIDAIFGTGFSGSLHGIVKSCARAINASGAKVLSVDAPSGVDCDTGRADRDAVAADVTVTMGLPKIGQFFYPARGLVGELTIKDIGIPLSEAARRCGRVAATDAALAAKGILVRRGDTHKNLCGRVLIVAGSTGLTGAAVLSARAALKSGAGVVTLCVPESLNPVFEIKLTEEMTCPLPDNSRGFLTDSNAKDILKRLAGYDVLVLGPGLSRNPGTEKLAQTLALKSPVPVVLDADGLNAFAGRAALLKKARSSLVITPHEGEFRRMTGVKKIGEGPERIGTLLRWQKTLGIGIVLKGAPTLVSFGKGKAFINTTGNPGMATAGAGDVLTGLIGGLFAQSKDLASASLTGVYLHGLAGDAAALELTQNCLTAQDLIDFLPSAFKALTPGPSPSPILYPGNGRERGANR